MRRKLRSALAWAFDVPLRSKTLDRLARFYTRIHTDGRTQVYERLRIAEDRLLRRVVPNCEMIFDVGANVGNWSKTVSDINPACRVHAFEPTAAAYRELSALDLGPNVEKHNAGMSDAVGVAEICSYVNDSELSSLYRREDLEAQNRQLKMSVEEIRLDTIDDFSAERNIERIDFLKIDVEGHEHAVLRGAARMLQERRVRVIQIEYGTSFKQANVLLRDIFDLVTPHGFVGGRLGPDGVEKMAAYHVRLEDFRLSNWVFAADDHPTVWLA